MATAPASSNATGRTPARRWLRSGWELLVWPVRTALRITKDGLMFSLLAMACAVIALRADQMANIPLLICLVLFSMVVTSLILGGASLRKLDLKRFCSGRTFAGEPVAVTLSVHNNAHLPAAGLVLSESLRPVIRRSAETDESSQESQRLLAGVGGVARAASLTARGETFALSVEGKGVEKLRYTLVERRRGIYVFGRTRLSTVFPFGFWRSQAARRVPGRLVVYPRLGEINASLFQDMERAQQRIRLTRPSREEQDFRSLREYRHGDNPKWIHWRSSARMGKELVKEYEEPQTKRVMLLIDTNLQRMGTRRLPAFELALSFAATAAHELLRRGCEVTALAAPPGSPPERVALSRERRNLDQFLEMLAGLQMDNTRTLSDLRQHLRRTDLRNTYVLVLGLGSLRLKSDLTWLASMDNYVKVLDVRGEEFRRIFRRTAGPGGRDELDEDLLLALGDEELDELAQEELALVG